MMDKRMAEKCSALLSKNGYLRLSSDLVPQDARKKRMEMVVAPLPNKTLLLREATSRDKKEGMAVRRLMWANKAAKCPMIAIRSAMKFLGVKVPGESVHYTVDRRKNGELTIKF